MLQREPILEQIDRLVSSSVLHGSESLCKLLRYLAKHALDEPGVPLKEYQIATEVFGRPADFDPQTDSTIRVQAGRLRTKLSEYYASEGSGERIVVELPKGTYILSFHNQAVALKSPASLGTSPKSGSSSPGLKIALAAALILLTAAIAEIGHLLNLKNTEHAEASEANPVPNALQTFWSPFVNAPQEPWVIFSNAAFVGRPESGIRYYDSARDSRSQIYDHYTGVGEVLAVHNLDQVFAALHRRIRVKRGSLFSLDDAKNNDLIFIGSPSENLTLLDIPGTQEFIFQRSKTGPRKGDLGILNAHPQPGEPTEVMASPAGSPLLEDYAVLGFMPGLNPSRSVMILAGTTTIGTQAAVEYVTRENSVKDLLSRLSMTKPEELKPFEALVHVKIVRGVPVEAKLVAIRRRADTE